MQRWLRVLFQIFLIILPILLQMSEARAVPAMGMGYEPKYPPDFKRFDYVAPEAKKGGEIILYGLGTFDSLNPYLLKGISAEGLGTLVFESLLEKSLDEPFSMYGLIADDFYVGDDELSVTFHINPAARFSNGKPVTAEDVKFSFDTLMSKAAHPQFRVYYGDIESAEVIDRLTVRFNFKNRNRELHMIVGEIPIFSKEWLGSMPFDEVDDVPPISTGPYLVDSYERGRFIRYRRNPDYWAKDLPVRRGMYNFDTVTYKYYKDSTIALEAFKAGEFDFFFENYSKRWARSHVGPKYDSGEILKTELKHSNNAGMQGFAMNARRSRFKDVRVRRALTLAFDFEWSNNQLFYNQYERCDSYFSNSELAAAGLPQGKELALLEEFSDQLPASVFDVEWHPPTTDAEHTLRDNLKKARDLLAEAGWTVQDGVLKNAQGEVFEIDVLLVQKGFDRIFAPYAHNLKKLGIDMNYRTVDDSLYKRRMDNFEFDMVVTSFPQSVSPGNELMNMFHSRAAEMNGSRNLPGIADPVVDALIEKIINAEDREQLVVTAHALDRVLLHGEYLVPNWYIDAHRIAYRDKFNMPQTLPLYFEPVSWLLKTWWAKEKN
jgi:microcin C transport system substrate-binding protein